MYLIQEPATKYIKYKLKRIRRGLGWNSCNVRDSINLHVFRNKKPFNIVLSFL